MPGGGVARGAGTGGASGLAPGRVCTPIMHERTSADDQTAAQIDPSRASSERPHDVSAAMHKAGACAPFRRGLTTKRNEGPSTSVSLPNRFGRLMRQMVTG